MMATCMKALLWSFVFCFLIMSVWAMFIVEVVHPLIQDKENPILLNFFLEEDSSRTSIASGATVLHLFCTPRTSGATHGPPVTGAMKPPVTPRYPATAIIFVGSNVTLVFGVLNLIVAVVVDTFAEARQRDILNLAEELEYDFEKDRKFLKGVFDRMDMDGSGLARFLDKSGENDENIVVENESPESPEKPEEVRAENVPYEKCRWDFFLSHKQSNAQDAVQNLRLALSEHFLGASFWLDIEQDATVRITDSKFCRMEMRWALEANRNLILVKETDDRHGKPNMETLIERCPDDLKHIFSETLGLSELVFVPSRPHVVRNVIIPWFRDPEFRAVSVEKILQRIAVDPRRTESTGRRSAKPLVYGKGGEGEDAEAGSNTRRWAAAVRIIIFTCGVLCTTRLFTPEGPGFLDYATIIQAVTAHFMVFFQLHVMLDLLRSVEVQDLLENHIDCPKEGKKLKFKTKVLTAIVLLLTAVLSCWGWVGYLPGFWHPYYMASGNIFIAYGIAHGLAFLLILPIFFGSYFAILTIMNQLSKRLIFKNPINRRELLTFLAKLPLEFRSGFIQATPRGLLLFLPMLVLNTLGFVAEATRLFASL
eukprot:g28649.t1